MPLATLICPDTGVTLPAWECPDTGLKFATGARPSPRYLLAGAIPFLPLAAPPANCGYFPTYRSMFGNDRYGDCVTAEEAFAKSCRIPGVQDSIQIPEQTVISYARGNGELNGADLSNVLDEMARSGFVVGAQKYNDGPKQSVDYSNDTILQAAIAQGPVKVAIAASALPGGAGSRDGWYSLDSRDFRTDHCVSLSAECEAQWFYEQLKMPLPSGLSPTERGYGCYSWSTIGFVGVPWVNGTVVEAWARNPTTIGVPPLTPPAPPTPPTPPLPPGPGPSPIAIPFDLSQPLPAGKYALVLVQRPDL